MSIMEPDLNSIAPGDAQMTVDDWDPQGGSVPLSALDQAAIAIALSGSDGCVSFFNRAAERLWGYTRDEVLGRPWADLLPVDAASLDIWRTSGRDAVANSTSDLASLCDASGHEAILRHKDGRRLSVLLALSRLSDRPDGQLMLVALPQGSTAGAEGHERTGVRGEPGSQFWSQYDQVRKDQRQNIHELERDMLEALTSGLSFEEWGSYLCLRVGQIAPDVLPSLLRVDFERRLQPWVVSALPAAYNAAITGLLVGEGVGSCGTAAARGARVLVRDIATDPLWVPYREVALQHGLRACWSYPIKRRDGSVAATFAFYSREPSAPSAFHERIISASVHLCALAIEREENRQQMTKLVQFDALTGLPNRHLLHEQVDELLASGEVTEMACFCLDLDRLKDINGTLGHAAGDQVLVQVANHLRRCMQAEEFLCRAEGDLFVVVSPGCSTQRAALAAQRLLDAVRRAVVIGGHHLSMSGSVGISHYPGADRDLLLNNAKNAMYQAKEAGGNSYQFFNPEMNQLARRRLLLGSALKRAIAAGGLRLVYQPQVNTANGRLHGLEALARWHDPKLGNVPPDKFIGLAEEIGQIDAIGNWALQEACRQLAQWRSEGVDIPTVSVNLSPFNFRNKDLPALLAEILQRFGLDGASLTIEITESAMMALTPDMLQVVTDIRALGIGLSVDDFGTGFSSLSNLVNLPVTEVKIDRSFIDKCLEERRLQALVAAVIGMGRSLGLAIVAEGVENREQCELLAAYRCPVAQGYLFSRPIAPDDVPAWLAHFSSMQEHATTNMCRAPMAVLSADGAH